VGDVQANTSWQLWLRQGNLPPRCSDGVRDDLETDVDCGGGTCAGCAVGRTCSVGGDCASGTCSAGACTQDSTSCLTIKRTNPAATDGLYTIDPDGAGGAAPFSAFCDMTTAGGGWTRVWRIALGNACTQNASAQGDPKDTSATCAKYSDAVINLLASTKIFYSRYNSNAPLYTRFDGAIRFDGPPGHVSQSGNLDDVAIAAPAWYTPQYAGWVMFHQQNWYNTDRCFGAQAATYRLSLEYLSGTYVSSVSPKYVCTGACNVDCPTSSSSGTADVFVR
jgi:hypothetical protein